MYVYVHVFTCASTRVHQLYEESESRLLPVAAADGIPPTDFVCRHARVHRALKDRFSESLTRVVSPGPGREARGGLLLRGVPRDAARAAKKSLVKFCICITNRR